MSSIGSPAGGFFGSMPGANQNGSSSAFTSPPINPQALAALIAMMNQNGQSQQPGQQGPQMTTPGMQPAQTANGQPSPQALAALNPQQQQSVTPAGGANPQLLAALAKLSQLPPAQAKAILARIGIGGQQQQPPAMGSVQ